MLNWQYVNTKSNSYLYSQPWCSENELREENTVDLKRRYPETIVASWLPANGTWTRTQRCSYIKGEMFLILFEKEMLWSGWRWFWSSWCDTALESRARNTKQELYDLPPHANMPLAPFSLRHPSHRAHYLLRPHSHPHFFKNSLH